MGYLIVLMAAVWAVLLLIATALFGLQGGSGHPAARPSATPAFNPVVKLTVDPNVGGYEPAVYIDHFGNIFATAHKSDPFIPFGTDSNSPTMTRSMSWTWMSSDGGKTFSDIPGYPLNAQNHDPGDEGDMALDDANHLYFVDTNVTDDTFTRWTVSGLGKISIDMHRPVIPTAQPLDDRPWITAHGDGHVFYFGNMGDSAYDGGRYTVYASYDGGMTFNPVGVPLTGSGWCRPAADHTAGSKYVYGFCTDDNGALNMYVSADDGATFTEHPVGDYNTVDDLGRYPYVQVGPDGSVWAFFGTKRHHMLYHSTDHGNTWTSQDVTPFSGEFGITSMAVSPDGSTIGVAFYYVKSGHFWVYGETFAPGTKPVPVSLDPGHPVGTTAQGTPIDLLGAWFDPAGHLGVVWNNNEALPREGDCFFAISQ